MLKYLLKTVKRSIKLIAVSSTDIINMSQDPTERIK